MTSFDIIISRLDGIEQRITRLENTTAIILQDVHDLKLGQAHLSERLEDLKTFTGWGLGLLGIIIALISLFFAAVTILPHREKKEHTQPEPRNYIQDLAALFSIVNNKKES